MKESVILILTDGSDCLETFVFTQPAQCIVGRSQDCHVRVPSCEAADHVSRRHCELTIDPPSILVRDLGSCNGTFVNGVPIGQREHGETIASLDLTRFDLCSLVDMDVVRIGTFLLHVKVQPFSHGKQQESPLSAESSIS